MNVCMCLCGYVCFSFYILCVYVFFRMIMHVYGHQLIQQAEI